MGNSQSNDYLPGSWVEAEEFVLKKHGKPGDLISFDRGVYQHWAIYDGDGYVINVPAEDKNDTKAVISREKLVDVANKVPGKTKVRVNNLCFEAFLFTNKKGCDFKRSVETQLNAAREMIGQEVPYDFLAQNCEHFVTKCKYGNGFSAQTPHDGPLRISMDPVCFIFNVLVGQLAKLGLR